MTELSVLLDHPRLIAIHKPAGLTVIPARDEDPALAVRQRLEAQLGTPLWVVHRIDRETSGVVVFARDADAHRMLNQAFEHGQVRKTYLAWTAGVPQPPTGSVEVALHAARKGKMRPALPGEAEAKQARTDYWVEAQRTLGDVSVARVRCHPRSGRQHQIRVHLRSVGHPILRDALYGMNTLREPWASLPVKRLALHALRIELPDLFGDGAVVVEAALAGDLVAIHGWVEAR